MHYDQIGIFVEIARRSGISAAARQLGMPKSRVSKALADLELRLGVRLVERTSRRFRLTEMGQVYAARAHAAFTELSEAEMLIEASRHQPSGRLCISAPVIFGQEFLGPILAEFAGQFPKIDVEVRLENRVVDLIGEGVDVAIRSGRLPASTLIARTLDTARLQLAARPQTADALSSCAEPSEIKAVPIVQAGAAGRSVVLRDHEGRQSAIEIAAFPSFNDVALTRTFAEAADCVVLLPTFMLPGLIEAKRLRLVMSQWFLTGPALHVVYPSRRALSPKTQVFVQMLTSACRQLAQR